MRLTLLLTLVLCAPTTGFASSANQLVGEASLEVLFVDVYHSRLYTATGSYRGGQVPVRLELRYELDIPAERLVSRTAREWRHLGTEAPAQQAWLEQLEALWPDVRSGDRITFELDDALTSRFYYNDELLGEIRDKEFGPNFLAIWLSPDTSRPDMRKRLLGRGGP